MGFQVLVVGLAGSGKSTVGRALAQKLGIAYIDGDQLHPSANIQKMIKGTPLNDDDRDLWVANIINALEHGDVVIGASLLKRGYRDQVRANIPKVRFAQLDAPLTVLEGRLETITAENFRKPLLASQLAIFDALGSKEPGLILDATLEVPELIKRIVLDLKFQ
jgi:carbohydrate kinase (thermoresistant glucokinase family)